MKNWYTGTGKKKTAIAKVFIKRGKEVISVNNKKIKEYFPKKYPYNIILSPLMITKNKKRFKVKIKVRGGGVMSQIIAIRHGIAIALINFNKNLKILLSKNKLLTRDSRRVERKKLGKHKARKSKQFSKR